MSELQGKRALVTGAGRGIGKAVAVELARRGAAVSFTAQGDPNETEAALAEIASFGGQPRAFPVDAADRRAVEDCTAEAAKAMGGLDILVNNAGITADAVLWKMSEEQWDRVIAVNLTGTFNHLRAAAPVMRAGGWGRVVNISSINGLRGKFGQTNYCASKAGVIGLTKAAARELAAFGITVNCVAPGTIETGLTASLPEEVRKKALAEILTGRLGAPEDVAQAVAFLCGAGARHITGAVIEVDGGQNL